MGQSIITASCGTLFVVNTSLFPSQYSIMSFFVSPRVCVTAFDNNVPNGGGGNRPKITRRAPYIISGKHIDPASLYCAGLDKHRAIIEAFGGCHTQINPSTRKLRMQQTGPALGFKSSTSPVLAP